MTLHELQVTHEEILEDFQAGRITLEERNKRFKLLQSKAILFGLPYVVPIEVPSFGEVLKSVQEIFNAEDTSEEEEDSVEEDSVDEDSYDED